MIGLNDMEMARWESINLTTIHQPITQIIASSVELVDAVLNPPDRSPETRLFPCRIVERGTLRSRPVATDKVHSRPAVPRSVRKLTIASPSSTREAMVEAISADSSAT